MKNTLRLRTNQIRLKDKLLGGCDDILIQTMSNIKTSDIDKNLELIDDLYRRGCDLLRLSILDEEDARAIQVLVDKSKIPLIADLHFNKELALKTIKTGISKIRINPGNMKSADLEEIIELAKIYHTAIRIGINSGCLDVKRESDQHNIDSYFKLLDQTLEIFKKHDYDKAVVLALKSSSPELTEKLYTIAANLYPYPLHIGVTETGFGVRGMARTCAAIVPLLKNGIGNTIRISLTDSPMEEVEACKSLLCALNLNNNFPTLISCPTCGRTNVDMNSITRKVQDLLSYARGDFKVAVMGCPVNGPGEAKDADIGLAGVNNAFVIFEKGEKIATMSEDEAFDYLKKKIAILSTSLHINK